ncbi:hypothetical protein P154DRAFT_580299 [Amniculicola lignicola CBS 123094]|uniref:Uncharacterized protein n=1 Tax=Amniculicola lignicola CBS 123094 TaxID=1392246 RepID=A0A6A5W7H9_9PLEO|nr:hypothetical protein P154DRAFT_580299 [Amniculicola lignicola CBS 123094]
MPTSHPITKLKPPSTFPEVTAAPLPVTSAVLSDPLAIILVYVLAVISHEHAALFAEVVKPIVFSILSLSGHKYDDFLDYDACEDIVTERTRTVGLVDIDVHRYPWICEGIELQSRSLYRRLLGDVNDIGWDEEFQTRAHRKVSEWRHERPEKERSLIDAMEKVWAASVVQQEQKPDVLLTALARLLKGMPALRHI